MSQINISNLTFSYNGSYDAIFKHVSFCIDTNWKLGFIGRNGKGKTTLLRDIIRLLSDKGKFNISVIDERSEIAASYKGMTTNDLGIRTDVMTASEKKDAQVHNLYRVHYPALWGGGF